MSKQDSEKVSYYSCKQTQLSNLPKKKHNYGIENSFIFKNENLSIIF